MELQRDEFSVMTFNPETKALELRWSAGTASLTEERFRLLRGQRLAGSSPGQGSPELVGGVGHVVGRI